MKKKRPLTLRQKKLIKELVNKGTKTQKQAFIKAGYSKNTASKKTGQVIKAISWGLKGAMERAGLTDEYLASSLLECTQATKKTYAQFKGVIMDEREDPDYSTRKGSIDLATILRGDKVEKQEIAHTLGEMTPDEVADALIKAKQIVNQS